ncbi:MAG: Yip1 family protein [Anaerolineae bacterium]|nr:Yip1 family protein [Anaerolineae bacterium]
MEQISRFAGLLARGLFLRPEAYEEMRETRNPFVEGLFIVVVVGVIVALAAVIGNTLEWASTPDLAAIRQTVYDGLTNMDWFQQLEQAVGRPFIEQFQRQWDWQWRIMSTLIPTPVSSLAGIVTTPLRLIIGWLIYGLLAHLFARLLGGQANLGQTLGSTALAVTPQVLNLAGLLPFVTLGGVVGTWVLICRYMALKQAHRLSWGRAFWATVLPRLVIWLLALVLGGIVAALIAAFMPQFVQFLGGS